MVPEAPSRSKKQPGMGFSFVFRLRTSLRLQLTPPPMAFWAQHLFLLRNRSKVLPSPVVLFGTAQVLVPAFGADLPALHGSHPASPQGPRSTGP